MGAAQPSEVDARNIDDHLDANACRTLGRCQCRQRIDLAARMKEIWR
jgi:hypothetical protein